MGIFSFSPKEVMMLKAAQSADSDVPLRSEKHVKRNEPFLRGRLHAERPGSFNARSHRLTSKEGRRVGNKISVQRTSRV